MANLDERDEADPGRGKGEGVRRVDTARRDMGTNPRPSDHEIGQLESRLKTRVMAGLLRAGVVPHRRGCWVLLRLDRRLRFMLNSYTQDLRWWRITYDLGDHQTLYGPLRDYGELTFHRDEVTEQTGEDLVRFLREFPRWRWPLFAHDPRFPRYAWTEHARRTYTEDRLLRETRQRRIEEGRARR